MLATTLTITLTGNPLSTGGIYRSFQNRRYLITKAKERKEQYTWEAKSQWNSSPISKNIEVVVRLYFGDKRKRDWDNYHKLSMDALEDVVYENDAQIQKATVYKDYDKENPRIEIDII